VVVDHARVHHPYLSQKLRFLGLRVSERERMRRRVGEFGRACERERIRRRESERKRDRDRDKKGERATARQIKSVTGRKRKEWHSKMPASNPRTCNKYTSQGQMPKVFKLI